MVCGGAGFIGSHLAERIAQEAPRNLVVVDNLFLGKETNLDPTRERFPSLKFYKQDATDYDAMKRIVVDEAIDVVYNLAVIPLPTSLRMPRWAIDVNVTITTVFCELLRENCYQTLVHFSSSEAYGSAQYLPMDEKHPLLPSTPYAASKAACDHIVLSYRDAFGKDVSIVRPFNNFGPRQNEGTYAGVIPVVIKRALRHEPVVIYGDGEQTRDFIFVEEVASAAVRIYEEVGTRGRIINIATGNEVSINRLVRLILEILDVDVPIVYKPARPGDVRRHCGSTDLACKLIGFNPRTGLNDGLVETVAWYRRNLEAGKGVHGK